MDETHINNMFLKLLGAWVDAQGDEWGAKGVAAKKIGLRQGHLSNILSGRRKLSEKKRLEIIDRLGLPYDLIYGIDAGCVNEPYQEYGKAKVLDFKHIDIVKRFKNKKLATAINEKLLKLEGVDPNALVKVMGYIDCMLNESQARSASGDRRKHDHPDKIPSSGDRRKLGG
ncbi:MAG: helix-turn-helix transcriptional regulator [Desulfobacteraceae bacterium]|nr:helix-turn-helix transcriptional regulator [Desulfobacteraceae bacterium]